MKKSINKLTLLFTVLLLVVSCSNNDDNTATRSAESVEVILDNGTPQYFSDNILAKDYPLAPISGFSCEFRLTSEDTSGNQFRINFGLQTAPCPFTVTMPYSNTINGPISAFFVVSGVTFDDAAANSLNFTITNFGNNVGDDIDLTISGNYYEVTDPNPHTISITAHVKRD